MNDNGPIEPPIEPRRTLESDRSRDARLVARIRAGDDAAFGELFDIWFDRVFNVAHRIVHDHETAADVAQDTFLVAWRKLDGLDDAASFGGWVLRIARNGALDRARREARSTAVDPEGLAMMERHDAAGGSGPTVRDRATALADPALVAGDTELVRMVRQVAASLGERDAEVLDLTLRYQLTPAEVGEVLGLNRNAANQLCHRVRNRFATAFGARMLFDGDVARCDALGQALAKAGITTFGPDAVRVVDAHAQTCDRCGEERRTRLAPSALFASVPLVPVLAITRQRVAHALGDAGVPMHGSSMMGGGSAAGAGTSGHMGDTSHAPAIADPISGTPTDTSVREGTDTTRRRRRGLIVAAAAVFLLVTVVAILMTRDGDDESDERVLAVAATSTSLDVTTTLPRTPTSSPVTATTLLVEPPTSVDTAPTTTSEPGGRTPVADPTATVPATTTPKRSSTTRPASPTTTLPVTVGEFVLGPSQQAPTSWVDATGPRLTWTVTGASQVRIRRWVDTGNGDQYLGETAGPASGSRSACPTTVDQSGTCTAPMGHYTFELVAVRADGTTKVHPSRVSLWVVP